MLCVGDRKRKRNTAEVCCLSINFLLGYVHVKSCPSPFPCLWRCHSKQSLRSLDSLTVWLPITSCGAVVGYTPSWGVWSLRNQGSQVNRLLSWPFFHFAPTLLHNTITAWGIEVFSLRAGKTGGAIGGAFPHFLFLRCILLWTDCIFVLSPRYCKSRAVFRPDFAKKIPNDGGVCTYTLRWPLHFQNRFAGPVSKLLVFHLYSNSVFL